MQINLMGEILPVSLLKCKHALDAMSSSELLCITTDDTALIDKLTKFIHKGKYKIIRMDKSDDGFSAYIIRE
ncbi:MAG: sulfurtransferase TusA family protein [Thermodesulfobacteriota bacterium]